MKTFIKVYKDLLWDERFNTTDILFIGLVLSYQEKNHKCYITTKDIMWELNRSRKSIEATIRKLKKLKVLGIIKTSFGYEKWINEKNLERKNIDTNSREYKETQDIIESLRQRWSKNN